MRRLSIALAVLLGTAVPGQRTEAQALTFSLFERYLDSFRAEAGIPGMSGTILQNGVVRWERGFGRRDAESGAPALPETPYMLGGLSQVLGATLLLRNCIDRGEARLDDQVSDYVDSFTESQTTLRNLLSHTAPGGVQYNYSLPRFARLTSVVDQCTRSPYRVVLAQEIFDRFAMFDSAPDQTLATPTAADAALFDAGHRARYADVVNQMALPYRIVNGRAQRNGELVASRGDASDGVISTVRDLGRFVAALDAGTLLSPSTRVQAWTQTVASGNPLPTGLGWFVQNYNGEPIVWQFGLVRGGHSGLIIKAPNRGITMILLANSDALNAPFSLESGDVTTSVFARLFLRFFVP